METNHPINDLMSTTIQKIREMVDANSIIGEPIHSGEITLIPVSKISIGFGTGGSEIPAKGLPADRANPFGGGGGAGVKVTPVAFLVMHGTSVKLLPMATPADSSMDRLIEKVPEVIDQVTGFIDKKKGPKEADKA